MNTHYEDIVDVTAIGQKNGLTVNELLQFAARETWIPAAQDKEKVLVIGIDVQNDFMEQGELPVPGSHQDVSNFTKFIYNNLGKITKIAVSLDTHQPQQVFHAVWWRDVDGNAPQPFTMITQQDIEADTWKAQFSLQSTREYVEKLEETGKKRLMIWPYHCLQGTFGAALEGQFSNMVYFHSVVRQTEVLRIVKGLEPLSEMYGIFKAEYDPTGYINRELLNTISQYDKIIIGGEAKSHCVLESVVQLAEHFALQPAMTNRIYLLEDCMSSIPGFENSTEETFSALANQYGIHRVQSKDFKL